jgi:sugar-specific transcriptional regulator TrmB
MTLLTEEQYIFQVKAAMRRGRLFPERSGNAIVEPKDPPHVSGGRLWTKVKRKVRDELRLKSLMEAIAALEDFRKRYPRPETADEWEDYDGSVLLHSAINTLQNIIEGIKWKMDKRSYAGKIRNWFATLTLRSRKHTSTSQMLRPDADRPSSQRRVRISKDAANQALSSANDDVSDENEEVVLDVVLSVQSTEYVEDRPEFCEAGALNRHAEVDELTPRRHAVMLADESRRQAVLAQRATEAARNAWLEALEKLAEASSDNEEAEVITTLATRHRMSARCLSNHPDIPMPAENIYDAYLHTATC